MENLQITPENAEILFTALYELGEKSYGFINLSQNTENFMCSFTMELEDYLQSK